MTGTAPGECGAAGGVLTRAGVNCGAEEYCPIGVGGGVGERGGTVSGLEDSLRAGVDVGELVKGGVW